MKNTPVTQTSSTTNSVPQWLSTASQNNYNYASSLPTAPYTGEGVAGLTPQQLQAIQLQGQHIGTGQGIAAPAIGGATSAMNFTAPQLTATSIGSTVNGLMSPYQSQVVDAANYQLEQQRQQQQQQNDAQAARAGAFDSSRAGVVQAMTDRDFNAQKANTDATLLSNGYTQALQTALGMGQSNQSAALQSAGINLNGTSALGNLGTLFQNLNNGDVNGLMTTGGLAQNTNQAQDTFNYNTWLQQQQAALAKAQAMDAATAGARVDTTSNNTQKTDSYSNPLAQIAGLGLGAASLFATGGLSGGLMGLLGSGGLGLGAGAASGTTGRLY